MRYDCLLFDLDGTLIDSRADLAASVNLMLVELDREPLAAERVVGFVGEGVIRLVTRALRASSGREPGEDEVAAGLESFRRLYAAHLLDQTETYPEVRETLARLRHLPKAVVTNKPAEHTLRILAGLGLDAHFAAVIAGDTLSERKPSPVPLLEAARRCGATSPGRSLMIGDSRVDIAAGKAAGMRTCGYVPGFRGRAELVEAGADALIMRFGELLALTGVS